MTQLPPVAFVTIPFNVIPETSLQTVWLTPALAVGISVNVIITLSINALQTPFPVVVKVSVTLPAAVSAEEGM